MIEFSQNENYHAAWDPQKDTWEISYGDPFDPSTHKTMILVSSFSMNKENREVVFRYEIKEDDIADYFLIDLLICKILLIDEDSSEMDNFDNIYFYNTVTHYSAVVDARKWINEQQKTTPNTCKMLSYDKHKHIHWANLSMDWVREIEESRKSVEKDPEHRLQRSTRVHLWSLLDSLPRTREDEFSGKTRRSRLAMLSARKAMDCFEFAKDVDRVLYDSIVNAYQYINNETSNKEAVLYYSGALKSLADNSISSPVHRSLGYMLMSVSAALSSVIRDELYSSEEIESRAKYPLPDPFLWDSAYLSGEAISSFKNNLEKENESRKDYWIWYIEKALPTVVLENNIYPLI